MTGQPSPTPTLPKAPDAAPATTPATTPGAVYRRRCAEFGAERDRLERRSRRNGNGNLALFFLAAAALLGGLWTNGLPWYGAAGLLFVAFLGGVALFNRTNRALRRFTLLHDLNQEGLLRLARDWSALPLYGLPAQQPARTATTEATPEASPAATGSEHPAAGLDLATAYDLDLFGRAGLEHLLGTPNTATGRNTLRAWLVQPAPPATVAARRQAVQELGPQLDFRDEVGVNGRLLGATQDRYAQFIAWAEGEPWLHAHAWQVWVARLLPLLALGLAVAAWFGQPVYPALFAVLGVALLFSLTAGGRVGEDIAKVEAQQGVFAAYAAMFALLGSHPFASPALVALQQRLAASGLSADRQMHRLERLMPFAGIRRWVLFFPVEVATLWSFHLLWQLENWQRAAGHEVRAWLAALGEAEALIALATLHHDHPQWAFPELTEDTRNAGVLAAHNLAHPLLPPGRAVGNDVQVGPRGSFLLVTGSNMSGKSTLLRAIGVNTVLAQMGGPVCASALRLPPLTVTTSMRVQDSLEQGVSYFMAELRRLKAVLDCAQAAGEARDDAGKGQVLYLLDEILQGTNTAERQIAARRIIQHLVAAGAIGAVSTHDLTLAAAPELAAAGVAVHFTEQFTRGLEGPAMHFDYKLRPGIATSTNALKLMELVGLPQE